MSEDVVDYCRQRERLLAARRETAEARAETADAMRTLGGLLTETMVRNDVRCVRVADNDAGVRYIRVTPARRRAVALKNADDVVALLDGVASDVVDVPMEQVPGALARAVGAPLVESMFWNGGTFRDEAEQRKAAAFLNAYLAPALREVYTRLKRAFDPQGIFNPGRHYAWM